MVKHNKILLLKFLTNLGNFAHTTDKVTHPGKLKLKLIAKGGYEFPKYRNIPKYGQPMCFGKVTLKNKFSSHKNPDNCNEGHHDQLIDVEDPRGHCKTGFLGHLYGKPNVLSAEEATSV